MELEVLTLIGLSSIALFAALGGWISHVKNRQPLEGFMLGGVLGPIGVIITLRMPFGHRPMIDQGAWNSYRSMVTYQSGPQLLQLPAPRSNTSARR